MRKSLITMPGRYGDILWSLPTVREIHEHFRTDISFAVSKQYWEIARLIAHQPYVQSAFYLAMWSVRESAPITPRTPDPSLIDLMKESHFYRGVYHLGYDGWPAAALPYYISSKVEGIPPIRLDKPWITVSDSQPHIEGIAVGFSSEWIELKMGILSALAVRFSSKCFSVLHPKGSRHEEWHGVMPGNVIFLACDWVEAAEIMQASECYFGCLSALWVLANGVGIPTVIVEPSKERHHEIFWVDRKVRGVEQNHMVMGGDDKPTFDARAAGDKLEEVLSA